MPGEFTSVLDLRLAEDIAWYSNRPSLALVRDCASTFHSAKFGPDGEAPPAKALDEDHENPYSLFVMPYHPGLVVFDQDGMRLRKESPFSPFNAWQTAYERAATGKRFRGMHQLSASLQYYNTYASLLDLQSGNNSDVLRACSQHLFNNSAMFGRRSWFLDHGEWYGWVRPRSGTPPWFMGTVDGVRKSFKILLAELGAMLPIVLNINPHEMQFWPDETDMDLAMRSWLDWLLQQGSIVGMSWEFPAFHPRYTLAAETWIARGRNLCIWTKNDEWKAWASDKERVYVFKQW